MPPDRTYLALGNAQNALSLEELDDRFTAALSQVLAGLGTGGPVLILPPDSSRIHSQAGLLTSIAVRELGRPASPYSLGAIMPALGTHHAVTEAERRRMFTHCPADRFLVHDWRDGVLELGRLEAPLVAALTQGAASFEWPVQVNRIIQDGGFSLIISIGQVVPHEVSGMANHAKNVLVGAGGREAINKSHFAGALYGLERIMGRRDTPIRAFFDEALRRFEARLPPILWVLTVVSPNAAAAGGNGPDSAPPVHGIYAGFGRECFELAAALSQELNITVVDKPIRKAVVYLDPQEFHSAWIGNKAVYRTRMAIADGGELLILAPGVTRFGEDPAIDALIRRHGYCSAEEVQDRMRRDRELAELQSAAAHLIHGSSDGRFTIRYCPNAALSQEEVEGVRYAWGDLDQGLKRYPPAALTPGWNRLAGGEEFYWIPNPALGLWKA